MSIIEAKAALDAVINKSRVHFYKPIQIAEILYRDRVIGDIDLLDIESYRIKSRTWRDAICIPLLGRVSTSSVKYQDDIFRAINPKLLSELGEYNRKHKGAVEAYVYKRFTNKYSQLNSALNYCLLSTEESFDVKLFIDSFRTESGLKRSLDKVYEIVVYSLFSTLIEALELTVEISIREDRMEILSEFEDFAKSVMCLDFDSPTYVQNARVYRVGVTNAADRGLDMYSNWGPAIQIKHLSLDVELAKDIVTNICSDKVVIVCKDAEKEVIVSLLTQIGWRSRIQSIITETNLIHWYEKALRGKYKKITGKKLLYTLCQEITEEFPSIDEFPQILKDRHYENTQNEIWE